MEERFNVVSRWLVALAVLFIPLSVFILISGPWSYNFQVQAHQWTRYLLFVSWILLTLSLVTGIAKLVNPPLEEPGQGHEEPPPAAESGKDTEGEEEEEQTVKVKSKPPIDLGYSLLLGQAASFMLGVLIYVVYISWLILPGVSPSLLK